MAFKTFDKVLVKSGAKVFSGERPHGLIVSQPYEVQVHRVLTADQSPDGYGEVVAWRVPGATLDENQHWTSATGVSLIASVDYP